MPPLYDYKCSKCGKMQEQFNCIDNHKNGPICCNEVMNQHYGNIHVIGDFAPYIDHNIGDKPILVESKKHRAQLMKDNGLTEKYGKGWV